MCKPYVKVCALLVINPGLGLSLSVVLILNEVVKAMRPTTNQVELALPQERSQVPSVFV